MFVMRQAGAQAPATSITITGIVTGEDNTALADASVSLEQHGQLIDRVRSASDGRFTFAHVVPGSFSLSVRRLGYQQKTTDLQVGASSSNETIKVELEPVATDVEAVVIEGARGRLEEFNARRLSNNFGYFFDQNDIRKKGPRYVSELFRTVPGARLRVSRRTGNILELRNCTPRIWLDGVRADNAEIDELISPSEIAGLEVYPSFAGVPAQYMDKENRACGVILVWSRQQ
jgi:hypothetical protein